MAHLLGGGQLRPDQVPVVGAEIFSTGEAARLTLDHDAQTRAGHAPVLARGDLRKVDRGYSDSRREFRDAAAWQAIEVGSEGH